jgi:translation initiation factor 2 subunit 1
MTTSTPEKADGLKTLQDAIDKIKETIIAAGGVFNVQMAVWFIIIFIKS